MGNEIATPQAANNWRNWFPLITTYTYIAIVICTALWFFRWREHRMPWWTDVPVGITAMLLIGPAQHRLVVLGQEAALGILFRNRWLNELVGDWLIHFPYSTATHHIRHYLLSHYEFPNDPDRDAELVMARRAGFWPLRYSMLLRLSAYIRWNSVRTSLVFERSPQNPYYDPARPPSAVALRIGGVYILVTFAILLALYFFRTEIGNETSEAVLTYVLPAMWVVTIGIYLALPERYFHRSRLKGLYSPRVMTLMRITFVGLLNAGLGWTTFLSGRSAVLNYIALWMCPMIVTLALIMARHWRQHGNLPPGQVAWDRKPGLIGRWLLFPLNQHRHREKHDEPKRPWYDL
jgi:hypothetical protein